MAGMPSTATGSPGTAASDAGDAGWPGITGPVGATAWASSPAAVA